MTDISNGWHPPSRVGEFLEGAGALVINGQERPAGKGATFETVNPATEQVLAAIPQADEGDVDDAVQAAAAAHRDRRWRGIPSSKRGEILYRVADLIEKEAGDLAWVDVLDQGKPYKHALGEITAAARCFRYFAGWVDKTYGETIPVRDGRLVYSTREPVGVCGQIIPWNFPFLMAAWKIAPALAFGNTVVLKPAEQTPLSALWLLRILQEAKVPDGVVNLVQGPGEVTGAALVRHENVDKIAFTGSTEVGKRIMRESAEHLHKLTLELGGKSPNVVFSDAGEVGGWDRLARRAAFACFYNAGEVCTAGTRLLVHEAVHDEVVTKVKESAESTPIGPGWREESVVGPLISGEQRARVEEYVQMGTKEGAELVTGGGRPESLSTGFFFRPTVFDGVTVGMRIAKEEIFGPVLAVQTFADEDEAIALANDNTYGLAAAVWTNDIARAHRVADKIQAGTVWINTYGEIDSPVSFGGYKSSGIGRELGPQAIEAYTQVKSIWVAT